MDLGSRSQLELHQMIRARLCSALGNTRLLFIGAPFVEELVRCVEGDLLDALQASRALDSRDEELRRLLGVDQSGGGSL